MPILSPLFSPDGRRVIGAGRVSIWDAESGRLMLCLPGEDKITADFSLDGAVIRTLAGNDLSIGNFDARPARETFRKYLEAPPPRPVGGR